MAQNLNLDKLIPEFIKRTRKGQNLSLSNLSADFEFQWNARPLFTKTNNTNQLSEIRFVYNSNFQLVDCGDFFDIFRKERWDRNRGFYYYYYCKTRWDGYCL